MAPAGGSKRKRGDRTNSFEGRDEGQRPSPYRPGDLNLGHHNTQQQNQNFGKDPAEQGRGGRRGSRGGRRGGSHRSPFNSPNTAQIQARSTINEPQKTMSPPLSSPKPVPESRPMSSAGPPPPTESAATQTLVAPLAKPAPYYYEHVTAQRVGAWSESGRMEVLKLSTDARLREDSFTLGILFQELVHAGLNGRIDPADAGSIVRDMLDLDSKAETSPDDVKRDPFFDASSVFLDTISIVAENTPASPSLYSLVTATGISAQQMRRELDSSLLEKLDLVRKNVFFKTGIRQQTNLLYRQSNYNLLREESEGYSKLITDLFTTSNDEPPTSEVVEETFERVKGMIGAFDLDVGRVLDVSLDVFATVLVKQYRFFVKYFRTSSWWPLENGRRTSSSLQQLGPLPRWALPGSSGRPLNDEEKREVTAARTERDEAFWKRAQQVGIAAFFELGGRQTDESTLNAAIAVPIGTQSSLSDEDRKWMEITHTLPPPGSNVAAQVLGFKLRFYTSQARDPSDTLPVNIIYLAALLIKIGFVSLKDLYPHLWPGEDAMDKLKNDKMKEKAEKERLNRAGGGVPNALLAAAPLPDDTLDPREATRLREAEAARRAKKVEDTTDRSSPSIQQEEKSEELPEPTEQKVQLLKNLLCIGALPEALYMLGRFPWLTEAFPELPEYIHRILHHSISKVYELLRPLQDKPTLQEQQYVPDADTSGAPKGQLKLADAPSRKRKRWAQLDQDNVNEKDEVVDYRFYWDEWADTIPICQTVDDVFTLCSTLLNVSGVRVGRDTELLMKLTRIGSHSLATDTSTANTTRWIDLSKRLLVPALSLTKSNPGVVNEVFELIKNFSLSVRYSIYAEWFQGQISRLPELKTAFEQAKAETKDVLKRISKTTQKPMARALAKVAYGNPGIVFSVAIAQLESYENIIDIVVDCARYFTYLAYDVLTWSLMSALGSQGRNRVQADGMLTSKWLAALSLFAGKLFKRYSVMSPTPVVQYVLEQLRQASSTDLIVLEEITKSMAGIVSDSTFNEAQVMAMAGGDLLQAQTMLQLLDKRHESKTTAKRLMKSLTDSKLAGQVLVSIAQERQTCIFKIEERDAQLKLLGNLFDQLHRILIQYNDFLRGNMSIKEFDQLVPSIIDLVTEYGVNPGIAFWLSRPSILAAMAEYDTKFGKRNSNPKVAAIKEIAESEPKVDDSSDEKTVDVQNANASLEGQEVSKDTQGIEDSDIEMQDSAEITGVSSPPVSIEPEAVIEPWHPILKDVMDRLQPALPEDTWKAMSPAFYVTFWQCSLRDMFLSLKSYEDEIHRQRRKAAAIKADRSDLTSAGAQRKERDVKALDDLAERLQKESKECLQNYTQNRQRLQREKEHWFADFWGKWDDLNVALIEQCFFPRITLSAVDAMYTFKMLKYLHSSGATNFRTMGVYDQLFRDQRLTSMMFLCSTKEAENFGRFLNQVLADLSKWHKDKATFEKEAYGNKKDLPGFSKKMSNDHKTIAAFWDYEDFRRILRKWHMNLTNALKTCLNSREYMHIRNAVSILLNVHQNFPAVNYMGKQIVDVVTNLSQTESRGDLKLAAASLLGNLRRREKEWVMPQAFNLVEGSAAAPNSARSGSAKPSTPRPEAEASKFLNPKAPEFQPSPQIINGSVKTTKVTSGRVDAEDGEIEDSLMTDVTNKEIAPGGGKPEKGPVAEVVADAKSRPTSPKPSGNGERKAPGNTSSPAPPTNSSHTGSERRPPLNTASAHPSVPPRPEINRNASTNSRAQHDLPTRPEVPPTRVGDRRLPPRVNDRTPQDVPRDSRFPERPPTDRPRDLVREGPPERLPYPGSERIDGRSRGDRVDRFGGESVAPPRSNVDDRGALPPHRDGRQPLRDERPAPGSNARSHDHNLPHQDREAAMLPPRSTNSQHPDRVALNPERAALIHGNQEPSRGPPSNRSSDRRSDGPRHGDLPRSAHSSRTASPARSSDRPSALDSRRIDRQPEESHRSRDEPQHSRPRMEDGYAPSGPRTERPTSGAPNNSSDRFRDSMKPTAPTGPAAFDPSHGRLNQDQSRSGRQAESQYGRLNAANDVPSGPRLPNGNQPPPTRGNRNISAPQPPSGIQQPPSSSQGGSSSQDRQTPSGPAMRGTPRVAAPANSQNSAASTPASQDSELAGLHPDRLRAMQGPPGVLSKANGPDRGDVNRAPRQPPPLSVPPPAPSRGPAQSPVQQSPTSRGGPPPPTGPSHGGDRNRDKRFAGLQGVLQQNGPAAPPERGGQGASIRGRGGRAMPSPTTTIPPTPNVPPPDAVRGREDLFAGRPNGAASTNPPDDEASYGRGGRRGFPRDGPREGERRSGRHRSRSPTKDRLPDAPPPRVRDEERPAPRGDPRDRFRNEMAPASVNVRGSGHERDLRGPPGPPERETRGGPPTRRSTREEPPDRRGSQDGGYDRRGGDERREGGGRDGGGSMRKRGRGGDEAGGDRHMDSKRPRRG